MRIVARLGQQSGLTANAFVNVTPWPPSSLSTVGMTDATVSQRWSSVRTSTMFGRAACASPGAARQAQTSAGRRKLLRRRPMV